MKGKHVIVTGGLGFTMVDLSGVEELMRTAVVVDGRRFFDADLASSMGFTYSAIGAAKNDML
jgi:hypothetical protein